jgi:glycosyltransferase involved in cell wall biosynthesis
MKKPLISVIVPVYNTEKYLGDCIDSIVKQTYPNIEIILVDDGSTDSSGRICDKWEQLHANIVCIHQTNAGVSTARNAGLDKASGEYIIFCDADDMMLPDMIVRLYDIVTTYKADMGVCSYTQTYPSNLEADTSDSYEVDIIDNSNMRQKVIYERNGYLWNKIFRSDILHSMRFDTNLAYMEDALFVHQYLMKISKVACTSKPLYMHRDNPDGIMKVVLSDKKLTLMVADERIYDLFVNNNVDKTLQRKVWNDLIKAYAISLKKVTLSSDKSLKHWKQYIKDGYNKYKGKDEFDNSWNTKEKVYLIFLKLYS